MASALSLACLAVYLAFSGAVLAAGGHAHAAVVHLLGVIVFSVLSRNALKGREQWIGVDMLPVVVWPFLYFEIPSLIAALGSSYHDALVQRWELALLGGHPSVTLASRFPWQPLSEVLHLGYLSYYPTIFIPPLVLLLCRDREGLARTALALGVTYAVCWVVFVFFPVQGPRYLWPVPAGMPDGLLRRLTTQLLAHGSSRGAAFPSSHMAIATVQAVIGTRYQTRAVAVILSAVAAIVGLSAVYGGFHYAIDILAGAALGLVIGTLVYRGAHHR